MRGHDVEYQNDGNVDGYGTHGVHATQPTASLTLDIELLEQPYRYSDQNGVAESQFERSPCCQSGDPTEACKYSCGRQRGNKLVLCRGVKKRKSSICHSDVKPQFSWRLEPQA